MKKANIPKTLNGKWSLFERVTAKMMTEHGSNTPLARLIGANCTDVSGETYPYSEAKIWKRLCLQHPPLAKYARELVEKEANRIFGKVPKYGEL
jgi:hypothetical protein